MFGENPPQAVLLGFGCVSWVVAGHCENAREAVRIDSINKYNGTGRFLSKNHSPLDWGRVVPLWFFSEPLLKSRELAPDPELYHSAPQQGPGAGLRMLP